jgi:hypothetical protein
MYGIPVEIGEGVLANDKSLETQSDLRKFKSVNTPTIRTSATGAPVAAYSGLIPAGGILPPTSSAAGIDGRLFLNCSTLELHSDLTKSQSGDPPPINTNALGAPTIVYSCPVPVNGILPSATPAVGLGSSSLANGGTAVVQTDVASSAYVVTYGGSGLVFDDTFGTGVTTAYEDAIINAENFFSESFYKCSHSEFRLQPRTI